MPDVVDRPITLHGLAGFHGRQREAMRAVFSHTYTLYGGAAGGGKSYWLRWMLLLLLIRWHKRGIDGVRVGLFSADYPSLHDRQLSKIRKEFPDWLGTFNESTREFRLCAGLGGGVICFRNLDDAKKYKSAEFGAIGVEELTESELAVFDDLRWRLRWPGVNDVKFLGATNPGGIGHHWVKGYWIDRIFPAELDQSQFAYVRALAAENPHNDPSYQRMLDSLPDAMRAALRDGSWDYFVGQVFSEFRRDLHTCKPFGIPQWWRRWIGHDPGYSDPGVWLWFAADQDGNVYVYREATLGNGTMGGVGGKTPTATPTEQAREVKRRSTSRIMEQDGKITEQPEDIGRIVCGMDAWYAKDKHVAKSDVDYYREGGLANFRRPIHGAGSRAQRAKTLHEYLRTFPGKDGKPAVKLRIFETCKRLIETLPSLVADPNDVEAVADSPVDHWYDACLIGETLVATSTGDVRIEAIREGDSVLTRQGFRRVLRAGLTMRSVMVYDVALSNGTILTGTASHPVWTDGRWKAIGNLAPGDEVMTCDPRASSFKASHSGDTPTPVTVPIGCTLLPMEHSGQRESAASMKKSGWRGTGQFLAGIMSTTKTLTRSIMRRGTLSALLRRITGRPMLGIISPCAAPISSESENWSRSIMIGQERQKQRPNSAPPTPEGSRSSEGATNAGMNTQLPTFRLPDSAPPLVVLLIAGRPVSTTSASSAPSAGIHSAPIDTVDLKPARGPVVRVCEVRGAGMWPVFNLSVEGVPEFFANGVLVHNCTYGVSDWHASHSDAPEEERFKPGTAGQILNHAELLAPRPKDVDPFARTW